MYRRHKIYRPIIYLGGVQIIVLEAISGWVSSDIFPPLKRVGFGVYECEYYKKVTAPKQQLLPKYYQIYKVLRDLRIEMYTNQYCYMNRWREQFNTISDDQYREGLIEAVEAMGNWSTHVSFEISPRNIAVKDGKLILLDCFYFPDQLKAIRKSRKKQYQS